jgi:hypothetical protein
MSFFIDSGMSICKLVRSRFSAIILCAVLLSHSACQQNGAQKSVERNLSTVLSMVSLDYFDSDSYISSTKGKGYFTLSEKGKAAPIVVSDQDYAGVLKVALQFKTDIAIVTDAEPEFFKDSIPQRKRVIIVGTLGRSPLIDQLISNGKIDLSLLEGKWEQFIIQVVAQPFDGVDHALVIAGSDKRGTIYGMYDLSENIGVSPWYWWADVPVKKHAKVYVKPGQHTLFGPAVKYRGIFINDEAPAMTGWAHEKFGGFNHQFYDKVFELILRLKGNYLWPAMWGRSLFDDDPLSAPLADEYGIVLGTTHHEPMMRSHVEWSRYGEGPWNYDKNPEKLRQFWREGLERMGAHESIVTLGMRGDGDEAMSDDSNIALLQKIIEDQRGIIKEVTGRQASEVPQLWALYKEVQEYYNKGMRVPDDVTLLLCDDNWGNQRILPGPGDTPPGGGYGIYYHFDFVGGPRNYKWLNTSPISRVWEQMHLAYRHGVDRIWLVNVGDLKPMELPISFFLDFAWNPENIPAESIPDYHTNWAKQQFGERFAKEIGDMLMLYTKFNGRRKPEMLAPNTYSLIHHREAETVVSEYNELAEKAKKIYGQIPDIQKDAYFQLVLFPILACANLNELHVSTGLNQLYADQGRVSANTVARRVEELFSNDTLLSNFYHDSISGGKWNHMMSQTHISYTYWQQPEKDMLPELKKVIPGKNAEMGVAIEGSDSWWPAGTLQALLPKFDVYHQQHRYIEIFNRGSEPFDFRITTEKPWIKPDKRSGTVIEQERIEIGIDWPGVPEGFHQVAITIHGPGDDPVEVIAEVSKPTSPAREVVNGFIEGNGYISMEAVNYSGKNENDRIKWVVIPDLGRTGSSITPFPVTASRIIPGKSTPHLEYDLYLFSPGTLKVMVYVAPTLNIYSSEGLKYAISFDDEPPQIINIHEGDTIPDWKYPAWWNNAVSNNIRVLESEHEVHKPGAHTLKYWMVDPAIVLQKIVIVTKEVSPSYLGPPESYRANIHK